MADQIVAPAISNCVAADSIASLHQAIQRVCDDPQYAGKLQAVLIFCGQPETALAPAEQPEDAPEVKDTPNAMTKKAIHDWLVRRGADGVMSATAIASILGVTRRVVKNAEYAGRIKSVDRGTFALDDIVNWLYAYPRYVQKHKPTWDITPEIIQQIKGMVVSHSQTLLHLWNDDLEDLTSEICYRMSKNRHTSDCPIGVVIQRIINKIWREMKSRGRDKETSLDALYAKGFQR